MKLDNVGSHFAHPDGVIIPQPQLPRDEVWRQIIERDVDDRRKRIGDQIGIFPDMGGFEPPPAPPSHRGSDDDDDDGDNGIVTFDM